MTPCNVALLKRSIAGPVREHFPLSPLTTFGVGVVLMFVSGLLLHKIL